MLRFYFSNQIYLGQISIGPDKGLFLLASFKINGIDVSCTPLTPKLEWLTLKCLHI